MEDLNQMQCKVGNYEDLFRIEMNSVISILKIRTVQAMIQIDRPMGWTKMNIRRLGIELKSIELYNAAAMHKYEKCKRKWDIIK